MTDLLRVMAIDHGLANIGIALSDPLRIIAKPYSILKHISREADFKAIAGIVQANDVGRIIIGVPTTTGGGLSRQAVVAVDWGCKLERFLNLPVFGWDESYTSVTAGEIAGKKRAKQGPLDDVAAAVLLQDYLDSGGTHGEPGHPIQAIKAAS
jgi:putative Holliday junction resolvase